MERRAEWRDAVKRTALAAEVALAVDDARRIGPLTSPVPVFTTERRVALQAAIDRARNAGVTYTESEIGAVLVSLGGRIPDGQIPDA